MFVSRLRGKYSVASNTLSCCVCAKCHGRRQNWFTPDASRISRPQCASVMDICADALSFAAAARLLRGSVSDGSEESLATSEGDDVGRLVSAPISPLVGAVRYQCQPSVIPGHFRHRVVPPGVAALLSQVASRFSKLHFVCSLYLAGSEQIFKLLSYAGRICLLL